MIRILLFVISILLFACKNSHSDEVKKQVTEYIKEKVKNPSSYKPISFSSIDTVSNKPYNDTALLAFMKDYKPDYKYSIRHDYEIENSDNELVKMSVYFHFDSTFKIRSTSPSGLGGDYGQLTGNVYWKYNNYVGNKPDAGSTAVLYALDTLRKEIKYEATADVMGNFKFDKILPGKYLLIVTSKNTTNSPDDNLDQLLLNSYDLLELFGYNVRNSNQTELKEYNQLDSLFSHALLSDDKEFGGLTKRYDTYRKFEKQKMEVAEKIIDNFPKEFKSKLRLYSAYSRKLEIRSVRIEEGKTTNEIIDFGITYF